MNSQRLASKGRIHEPILQSSVTKYTGCLRYFGLPAPPVHSKSHPAILSQAWHRLLGAIAGSVHLQSFRLFALHCCLCALLPVITQIVDGNVLARFKLFKQG